MATMFEVLKNPTEITTSFWLTQMKPHRHHEPKSVIDQGAPTKKARMLSRPLQYLKLFSLEIVT